jgi:Domain of unknown function (DUF6791)/ThiF family
MVGHVPYVNQQKAVDFGILASALDLQDNITTKKPQTHVGLWVGSHPCDSSGSQLAGLVNNDKLNEQIGKDLTATISFSQKPRPDGYNDYYEKMTTYVKIIEGHARAIDQSVTSRTHLLVPAVEEESVFNYIDNASSLAGITEITEKLHRGKIAIVGVGGTGAYVLDLLAKTPVLEIHLFDGDSFDQHNAFRSPGAASKDDLRKTRTKVEWYHQIYSRIRKGIVPHPQNVTAENVGELKQMDFVFLCMEGAGKRAIVDYLVGNRIAFIDVGMGLHITDNKELDGHIRVTTCTPGCVDHLATRIDFAATGDQNEYSRNIQIADMNALNAAFAVMKWKKLWGFYFQVDNEHHSSYAISIGVLTNAEICKEARTNTA